MDIDTGTLVSINVGSIRDFDYRGEPATSAIWKTPVEGRVVAKGVNLQGDDQADRTVHGGPDQAIYAYALEDLRWWQEELGRELVNGQFGENFDTVGIDVTGAIVGERWAIGNAVFEVSGPRVPCWKFAHRMGDPTFLKSFTQASRPGSYLRIVTEGDVGAGDDIQVVERPDHGVSIGDMFRIYTSDRDQKRQLLEVPRIASSWREWAAE